MFQELAPSCVLVGVLTRERVSGACFMSKRPRVYRPLHRRALDERDIWLIFQGPFATIDRGIKTTETPKVHGASSHKRIGRLVVIQHMFHKITATVSE